MDSSNSISIFEDAQLISAEFYANAFELSEIRMKQDEIENSNPIYVESTRQAPPRQIDSVMDDDRLRWERNQLGKNLLDSFALIFSQPGPKGVVATGMEHSGEKPNDYTLWVAGNSVQHCPVPKLGQKIRQWFRSREPHTIDEPSLENCLWSAILRNCHSSIWIALKVYRAKVKKGGNFKNTQIWMNGVIASTRPQYEQRLQDVQDTLQPILVQLDTYLFPEGLGPNTEGGAQIWKNDNSTVEQFNTITKKCFLLLESSEQPMNDLFNCFLEEAKSRDKQRLKELRRLIYIMASYRRAWHDMVRFKTNHRFATLHIKCIPNSEYCKGNSIRLTDIFTAGIRMRVYEKEDEERFMKEYSYLRVLEKPRVHCEMRILDFFLRNTNLNNFFNYIGCSKGPCWLCYHTLKYMAPEFRMRASHWK
ncbi:hypothetical protein F4776DRAFT_221228 [Hypoxylon sp. NC0597]|nr:hypothetical protein F4776DRAFT_221228 [Hypoxylon sp. NC0597]